MYRPHSVYIYVPFYQHGLTLIQAWISNYIHYKVWGKNTYSFPNFNGATVTALTAVMMNKLSMWRRMNG